MDNNTIISSVSIALSVIGSIILAVKGKRIVSKCCTRTFSASLDIQDTTPQDNTIPTKISPPIIIDVQK
jgi:hypothetical protein